MQKVTIITHNGSFHPDDCFAVATLLILLDNQPVEVAILRTRDEEIIKTGNYVVDIGNVYDAGKDRFDHHQEGGAGSRDNGLPYAAFGLVWKKYGTEICGSEKVSEVLDKKIVQTLDALDNGLDLTVPLSTQSPAPYTLDSVIRSFLPSWKSPKTTDGTFYDAVAFAKTLLIREIELAKDNEEGTIRIEKAYEESEDKRIIFLDKEYDWEEYMISRSLPLLVIYPIGDNFHIKAIKENPATFKTKIMFPASWAGKRDKALEEIAGVPGAIFCHNKRFVAVANSKEGALALAKIAIEKM